MKKLLLLMLCFLLVGCSLSKNVTPEADNIDYFNDMTCDAPCVLGITPGWSSEIEAKEIIGNNSSLTNCKEFDQAAQGGFRWMECNNFHVVFQDNLVGWIVFSQSGLTIEQVIQKYGIPDALTVDLVSLPDSPFRSAMILRYNKIRLQVNLAEMQGQNYEIKPATPVTAITFNGENQFETLSESFQDLWVGYGIYPVSQK